MSNALQAFDQMPKTYESAQEMTRQIVDQVRAGDVDPLKLRIFLKYTEKVIGDVLEQTDAEIMREADKYGTRFELLGAEVQVKASGGKQDYSLTGDPVLPRLQAELEMIQARVKERQDYLKTIPEAGVNFIDEETGDVSLIHRSYVKGGKLGLAITLKKGGDK